MKISGGRSIEKFGPFDGLSTAVANILFEYFGAFDHDAVWIRQRVESELPSNLRERLREGLADGSIDAIRGFGPKMSKQLRTWL